MKAWMRNHASNFVWDVITPTGPNFNGGLIKPLLKLVSEDYFDPSVLEIITHPCPYLDANLANIT